MSRKEENASFECIHCKKKVLPLTNGSYRNHCPFCLTSRHVDKRPGDRKSACGGTMVPLALIQKRGRWQIIHKCKACGHEKANQIAEDTAQPDDIEALVNLFDSCHEFPLV